MPIISQIVTYLLQVIFGGLHSNRTLTHIINQSSLIEMYRKVHVSIEQNFHIKQWSMHHAAAKMANMLQVLQDRIKGPHPRVKIEAINVLLKGAQVYIGGEEAEEGDEIDDENEADWV